MDTEIETSATQRVSFSLLPGGKKATKNQRVARRAQGPQLDTLIAVRKEMGSVYRRVWRSQMPSDEGSRRTFMLSQIGKIIEAADLEARIAALEGRRP
jgi:hypothetical protein